ncbi:hypothetical protein [Natronobiforma cellulositropha]|uniref:hypothetical protein n=1 Tax=Natronobiforma cellulositropha TaxID=1679076 RepID=UPI0021D58C2D|nr:hypothetical protein [Natronobiforma cellulositropha]
MNLCVEGRESEPGATGTSDGRRRIDVTDVHAAGVAAYARECVGSTAVSLEHRGARTYLVVDE